MPDKKKRYAKLGPLSLIEKTRLATLAINFFAPLSYREMCELIGKKPASNSIQPLSGRDFLTYLDKSGQFEDPNRNIYQIRDLLRSLSAVNILSFMGQGNDTLIGGHYYFQKELTNLERQNYLWLAPALGAEFIYRIYSDSTIQITGKNGAGDVHAGTALVIAPRWLLTCAHVLKDMIVDEIQFFRGKKFLIEDKHTHESIDVGLIKTASDLPLTPGLSFRGATVGETVFTVGFPRVPLTLEPKLIMHRGEITSTDLEIFSREILFTYSAIARPGNSGGPIVGEHCSVLGIVSRELSEENNNAGFQFFAGVGTTEIVSAVRDLVPDLVVPVENFE